MLFTPTANAEAVIQHRRRTSAAEGRCRSGRFIDVAVALTQLRDVAAGNRRAEIGRDPSRGCRPTSTSGSPATGCPAPCRCGDHLRPAGDRHDHLVLFEPGVVPGDAERAELRLARTVGDVEVAALGVDGRDVLQQCRRSESCWPLGERLTSAQAVGSLSTTQLVTVIAASTAWIAPLILML